MKLQDEIKEALDYKREFISANTVHELEYENAQNNLLRVIAKGIIELLDYNDNKDRQEIEKVARSMGWISPEEIEAHQAAIEYFKKYNYYLNDINNKMLEV